VATTRADDLPLIINNKDKKIDLVLAEFRLIEMNKYELLEKIRSICEIPVVGKQNRPLIHILVDNVFMSSLTS
jgi:CheY-like chemotaxis protein